MSMIARLKQILLALFLFSTFSPALAEPVHIVASAGPEGGEEYGQGWTLTGPNGECWALTAGHVVEDASAIQITGANGRTGFGRQARHHPDVDIAFVPIEGPLANPCSGGSYGYPDLDPILARLIQTSGTILLDRVFPGGTRSVIDANVVTDENDGRHFVVRLPASGDFAFSRGMSGMPLRSAGTGTETGVLIGIVIEALLDDGEQTTREAAAVRMDVIRDFIFSDLAPPPPITGGGLAVDILEATRSRDAACGPLNALAEDAECGWRPAGSPWSRIVLRLNEGPISRPDVRILFADGAGAESVLVRTAQTEAGAEPVWGVALPCPTSADQTEIACRMNVAAAQVIRIDIKGERSEIRNITIAGEPG
jgi:hypothetical protein